MEGFCHPNCAESFWGNSKQQAQSHYSAAITVRLSQPIFQAGLRSALFRSRREERGPLLFDLRTTTLGAFDLALRMFGKS
jgi:hypothetical protein